MSPNVIEIQPCRTTAIVWWRWSMMCWLRLGSACRTNGRKRSTRCSQTPIRCAAVSEASTVMNSPRMATPPTAPTPAARITAGLRSAAKKSMSAMPRIGSSSRAMMFQTPVTMSDVEIARRVNPHDRSCL